MSSKKVTIDNFFSKRLKLFIKETGLKKNAFAESIGITHGYLSMILSGKRGPSAEMIANLYLNYRDKFYWLLTGIDQTQEFIREQIAAYDGAEEGEGRSPEHTDELTSLLSMACGILTSNTHYKDSLELNICSFHRGLKQEIHCDEIHRRLDALEKKTNQIEHHGTDAKTAPTKNHAVAVIKNGTT